MSDSWTIVCATLGVILASLALLAHGVWRAKVYTLRPGALRAETDDAGDPEERLQQSTPQVAGDPHRLLVYISGISLSLYVILFCLLIVVHAANALLQ